MQYSSVAGNSHPADTNTPTQHSTAQPQQQQQQQQQQLVKLPELPDALFGHLPGALLPDYLDNAALPLVHVTLVQLAGSSGCILGLRMSHLMGDWGSARLLLRSIAAAYSQIHGQQPQQAVKECSAADAPSKSHCSAAAAGDAARCSAAGGSSSSSSSVMSRLPQLTPAAPLLNKLVAATRQQLPHNFEPVRLKLQQPADTALFEQLAQLSSSSSCGRDGCDGDTGGSSSSSGQPQRLAYHVLPERIQQLKLAAQADIAAVAADSSTSVHDHSSSSRACTSHNVLLARLLQAFCSLPGRSGLPHDVAVSIDMRGKLPLQQQQYLSEREQQQLGAAFGNFFASAIMEDVMPEKCSLGELAMQLRAAVERWVVRQVVSLRC
jgi:hypothetical protein